MGKAIETNTATETIKPEYFDIINVQVRKEGDKEIILLEGKEITRKDLANQGKVEKVFVEMLNISDTISADTKIDKVSFDYETAQYIHYIGPFDTINSKNKKNFNLIKKADSTSSNYRKFKDGLIKNPLYILNGKEFDGIKPLNQNDIESVYILKGAAAEKKYGKKARKGVIQITTKKEK